MTISDQPAPTLHLPLHNQPARCTHPPEAQSSFAHQSIPSQLAFPKPAKGCFLIRQRIDSSFFRRIIVHFADKPGIFQHLSRLLRIIAHDRTSLREYKLHFRIQFHHATVTASDARRTIPLYFGRLMVISKVGCISALRPGDLYGNLFQGTRKAGRE